MLISFSQKPKWATKASNNEINSVSQVDKSTESESECPQLSEMINNPNDLAESSNTKRPSN